MLRIFLINFFILISFQSYTQEKFIFKNGDILFQIGKGGDFENAITSVTVDPGKLEFSHVGIINIEGDSVFVLEASPKYGVTKTLLEDFIESSMVISIGRLKKQYENSIHDALITIKSLYGKPYDFLFLNDNDTYYCSELIQIAFKNPDGSYIFDTIPISFKDKETGKTHAYWIEYYKEYGEMIPEGVSGTNPSQLSKSDAIDIIHTFFYTY